MRYHNITHLHSNMFLLFRTRTSRNTTISRIYIPICFYYFNLTSYMVLNLNGNLHSNMFLLFLSCLSLLCVSVLIYIPICFYYFHSLNYSLHPLALFTFQYVSIISVSVSSFYPARNAFTFQYVSIISYCSGDIGFPLF